MTPTEGDHFLKDMLDVSGGNTQARPAPSKIQSCICSNNPRLPHCPQCKRYAAEAPFVEAQGQSGNEPPCSVTNMASPDIAESVDFGMLCSRSSAI